MLGDVVMRTEGGGISPIILHTGYTFDLEHVDLANFAQSSRIGQLAAMEESGSAVRVLVEVGEKVFDVLQAELAKHVKPRKDGPYAHATQVVSIEPGLMVATGGAGTGPASQALPVAGTQTPAPPANQVSQSSDFGEPQAGAQSQVSPTPLAGATESQADNAPAVNTDWKDGKTLGEQEDLIKASTDRLFLKRVESDKNETKKMQRLAKARLAELD